MLEEEMAGEGDRVAEDEERGDDGQGEEQAGGEGEGGGQQREKAEAQVEEEPEDCEEREEGGARDRREAIEEACGAEEDEGDAGDVANAVATRDVDGGVVGEEAVDRAQGLHSAILMQLRGVRRSGAAL